MSAPVRHAPTTTLSSVEHRLASPVSSGASPVCCEKASGTYTGQRDWHSSSNTVWGPVGLNHLSAMPTNTGGFLGMEINGMMILCKVCGDKASGFHYGVHACEGCKGFFRRSIQQKIQYKQCTKNEKCSIMRVNRNRCQHCRLKKCLAVGMSRDAVRFGRVPKREKARLLAELQNLKNQTESELKVTSSEEAEVDEVAMVIAKAHHQTCSYTREKLAAMKTIQPIVAQNLPNLHMSMVCPLNPFPIGALEGANKMWEEFSERFTPAIKEVVEFAKRIPGFQQLNQTDQITLLKAGCFEVLLVRLCPMFDCKSDMMTFVNGVRIQRSQLLQMGCGELINSMFDFAEKLNVLNLMECEIALFTAVVLVAADRQGVKDVEAVERLQERLIRALRAMVAKNHPEELALFAKLLMKLPDLRTLNTLHSEKLLAFKMDAQNDAQGKQTCPMNLSKAAAASPQVPSPTAHAELSPLQIALGHHRCPQRKYEREYGTAPHAVKDGHEVRVPMEVVNGQLTVGRSYEQGQGYINTMGGPVLLRGSPACTLPTVMPAHLNPFARFHMPDNVLVGNMRSNIPLYSYPPKPDSLPLSPSSSRGSSSPDSQTSTPPTMYHLPPGIRIKQERMDSESDSCEGQR
ncbi:PREDICTED: nuclear receptor subfamily 1 group D member 2-like isoform X1 [Branchiostoma belcheri]|uniref:Nuclear receptor subfamily 1 group D member 2-like isoform X1 n=2 Tax=Branchiostoma belcheri TaxID=7741 RepID=A0A6P4Y7C3_BRABE|nr:PREDICTED: nuclear receptor subfamily 1 group D member 2-like isoform X1 [Branchiostoma belcheri]